MSKSSYHIMLNACESNQMVFQRLLYTPLSKCNICVATNCLSTSLSFGILYSIFAVDSFQSMQSSTASTYQFLSLFCVAKRIYTLIRHSFYSSQKFSSFLFECERWFSSLLRRLLSIFSIVYVCGCGCLCVCVLRFGVSEFCVCTP